MIEGAFEIVWHGVRLALLPDRAVLIPEAQTLLLADVHLGKPSSFRAAGVPVPETITDRDLDRLSSLIARCGAARLIVLGDLIHDAGALRARTHDRVAAWRATNPVIEIGLVAGNHDRKAPGRDALWSSWGIEELGASHEVGGLSLVHDPADAGARPTLSGHLHPVISVGDPRRPGRVRTPCFVFDGASGVLPAFGSFTGGSRAAASADAAVFAAGQGSVVPLTRAARAIGVTDAQAYDRA